jgi:hypothetical protein
MSEVEKDDIGVEEPAEETKLGEKLKQKKLTSSNLYFKIPEWSSK